MKQTGTTKKHAGGTKHHATHHKAKTTKHTPTHQHQHHKTAHHAVQHHQNKPATNKKPAPKQTSLAEGVACCSAEALATHLRLSGWSVSNSDTYALYRLTAPNDDVGATIQATFQAAMEWGLAGVRLASYWPAEVTDPRVILGLVNPDHAVLADRSVWWSWSMPFSSAIFPYAKIDEAWDLRWDL